MESGGIFNNGQFYGGGLVPDAKQTYFSNKDTGLKATNVQDAITEITSNFQDGVNTIVTAINTTLGTKEGDANYLDGSSTPNDIANVINQNLGAEPELLWTNSNPGTSFAAQTIDLDLSGYSLLIINCNKSTSSKDIVSIINLPIDDIDIYAGVASGSYGYARTFKASQTKITIGNCTRNGTTTNANGYVIPSEIYGVKKSIIDVEVNITSDDALQVLWTNKFDSGNYFAAQTIDLDLNDYTGVLIEFVENYDKTSKITGRVYAKIGDKALYFTGPYLTNSSSKCYRIIRSVDNMGIAFSDSYYSTSSGGSYNNYCCPYRIYGVKRIINGYTETCEPMREFLNERGAGLKTDASLLDMMDYLDLQNLGNTSKLLVGAFGPFTLKTSGDTLYPVYDSSKTYFSGPKQLGDGVTWSSYDGKITLPKGRVKISLGIYCQDFLSLSSSGAGVSIIKYSSLGSKETLTGASVSKNKSEAAVFSFETDIRSTLETIAFEVYSSGNVSKFIWFVVITSV